MVNLNSSEALQALKHGFAAPLRTGFYLAHE